MYTIGAPSLHTQLQGFNAYSDGCRMLVQRRSHPSCEDLGTPRIAAIDITALIANSKGEVASMTRSPFAQVLIIAC